MQQINPDNKFRKVLVVEDIQSSKPIFTARTYGLPGSSNSFFLHTYVLIYIMYDAR